MDKKTVCGICGDSSAYAHVMDVADAVTGDAFSILRCPSCAVKKTDPVPTDLSRYYAADLGAAMRSSGKKIYGSMKRALLKAELARMTRNAPVDEFLDVGCGAGEFAEVIRCAGRKVACADSSVRGPQGIEGLDVPYYQIDYATGLMDGFGGLHGGTVILRHVLEHVKDPGCFVERFKGYGAGYFYIVLPNVDSLKSRMLGRYSWLYDVPRHIWHFNRRSIEIFFERHCLTVIAKGSDTIPILMPSLYRYMRINRFPLKMCDLFDPKGVISTLSLPLDMLLPNDIMWYLVKT